MIDTIYMACYCGDGTTFAGEWDEKNWKFLGIDNDENHPFDIIRTEKNDKKFELFGNVISEVNYERDHKNLDKMPYEVVVKHWVQLADMFCNKEWVQMMECIYKVNLEKFYKNC